MLVDCIKQTASLALFLIRWQSQHLKVKILFIRINQILDFHMLFRYKVFKKSIMDSSIAISLILGGRKSYFWLLLNGIEIGNKVVTE